MGYITVGTENSTPAELSHGMAGLAGLRNGAGFDALDEHQDLPNVLLRRS